MTKLTQALSIVAIASFAAAPSAFAGEKMNAPMTPAPFETTASLDAAETKMMEFRAEAEVLGAVESSDLVPVEGPDGRTYYNHTVMVADLPDPALNLRVVETFEVEHEGQVFTNKLVEKLN